MAFYDDMQKITSGVLRTLKQGNPRYIAMVPAVSGGTPDNPGDPVQTPYDIDAAVRGVAFKYVDNSTVLATDLQCVMAVHPVVTPDMKGFVEIEGVRHKVVQVMPIPPSGTVVAYRLIFRK